MPASRLVLPLAPLFVRALVLAVLMKGMLIVVAPLERLDHPFGVVVLTAVLGAGDIRRRGERLLWANLGYDELVTTALFAATAIVTEAVWAAL